ncbi:Alfa-L-rhamnosidase [Acidisarcina polymorpha]|uniref:Alfa-L-rhamnosidase n=1 Tax=Acidisarcina polymorpha TaxID=2211140 RepID=A0A2Z5G2I2_9BACT|nr:alpha-L-rhamnosidase C-terminal domain-containing protein [Acidisarcina polymorpha]AXC13230.1 Alfa-L-rhamnosidase [Acidisarcina polymorpha]
MREVSWCLHQVFRLFTAVCLTALIASSAAMADDQPWKASWITHPTAPLREPLVLHFRRALQLDRKPSQYVVHVSADNRFILYVNGHRVGDGPARGDLAHWRYETFDLAPYLNAGMNSVTATIWNFGIYAPVAQITDRAAFLVHGGGPLEAAIDTPNEWMVEVEPGQIAVPRRPEGFDAYMANGPGEELDAEKYDWHWNDPKVTGGAWVAAVSPMRENIYSSAARAGLSGETFDNYWQLIPDALPHMAYEPTEAGKVVRSDDAGANKFPAHAVSIAAHRHVHLLLDRKTLTTGYPELTVSGGKGASIQLTYSEALYDEKQQKGDRDEVANRKAEGFHDRFLPDGGDHRTFEPLWWRTWRYLDLDIQTGDTALTLDALKAEFTAYPFEERASFEGKNAEGKDPDLAPIWEISWRTARLDAHETYMDTPYYEQLQYIGDTRIQALISYAVAGDDRLARQALAAFDNSRIPAGITQSRYPTSQPQMIPTFSLLWIGMLHDYWMYRPDPAPVKEHLPGTRTVLDWFSGYEQPDGLLKELPWWSFVDWVVGGKLPNYSANGESCTTTLEYLGALRDAADLERAIGDPDRAERDASRAQHVRTGLYEKCWDTHRKLLADNPDRKNFSQQTNVLGVLFDVIPREEQQSVLRQMMNIEPGTSPAGVLGSSYYFRFYLARALDHAGMADDYLASLKPWRDLLPLHFSTWPETPGDSRSDSHAWSAHPAYDMLTLVAGIQPSSPGFASVRISPTFGELTTISAKFPHPQGMISVHYERNGQALTGTVTLPPNLNGSFVWHGREQALHAGANQIKAD